jgi:hypothetical protein
MIISPRKIHNISWIYIKQKKLKKKNPIFLLKKWKKLLEKKIH